MDVQPFTLYTPDSDLSDLKHRLTNTRWPTKLLEQIGATAPT